MESLKWLYVMAARQAEFPLQPCPSHSRCGGCPPMGMAVRLALGMRHKDSPGQLQTAPARPHSSSSPPAPLKPFLWGCTWFWLNPERWDQDIPVGAVPPPRPLPQLNKNYHLGTNSSQTQLTRSPMATGSCHAVPSHAQQPHCQGFSCQHTYPGVETCDLFNCTQESCLGSRLTGAISATVRGTREL